MWPKKGNVMEKKMNNGIMSLVGTAKEKFIETSNITILANPKESFPKFVEYAKDSRKDHAKIVSKDVESKMQIASEVNAFYSERIKEKEKMLQNVDLTEEERRQIQADIKACEAKVDSRYDDASNAGTDAIEEHRQFSLGYFFALLSIGTGIGGIAYAVNKVK